MDQEIFTDGFENYDDFLQHYGVGHDKGGHSGRYPWGSGKNAYQHQDGTGFYADRFMSRYNELKKSGISDKEIFKAMGLGDDVGAQTIRATLRMAKHDIRRQQVEEAKRLMEKYDGNKSAVARAMGKINSCSRQCILANC